MPQKPPAIQAVQHSEQAAPGGLPCGWQSTAWHPEIQKPKGSYSPANSPAKRHAIHQRREHFLLQPPP
ncbi:MAG: hypothetical protein ACR2PH_04565, partial [Desulfobulbia bacterium]